MGNGHALRRASRGKWAQWAMACAERCAEGRKDWDGGGYAGRSPSGIPKAGLDGFSSVNEPAGPPPVRPGVCRRSMLLPDDDRPELPGQAAVVISTGSQAIPSRAMNSSRRPIKRSRRRNLLRLDLARGRGRRRRHARSRRFGLAQSLPKAHFPGCARSTRFFSRSFHHPGRAGRHPLIRKRSMIMRPNGAIGSRSANVMVRRPTTSETTGRPDTGSF